MAGQAQLLARWDDFSGGHWGAAGGARGTKGSWGGKNVAVTRAGSLAPVAASRPFEFSNLAEGEVWGAFWAWGVDGRVYFIQETSEEFYLRRFMPNFDGASITIDTIGSELGGPLTRLPAWCMFSEKVYLSLYGIGTFEIDPTAPSYSALSGAPGGRAIAPFGEHLMVAGVDDGTFGTIGNRVVFNETGNLNSWPGLNFFDVGTDLTEIAALDVMLDVLIIIFSDQTMHSFRGVPGSSTNAALRKVYGYHAGSGGINTFVHANAVVDPAQARLWLFDHTARALCRFNGSVLQRITEYGMLTAERTSELHPDGLMVAHGGPDDLVVDRVPTPRTMGEGAQGESNMVVRVNGAFGLIEQRVVKGRA